MGKCIAICVGLTVRTCMRTLTSPPPTITQTTNWGISSDFSLLYPSSLSISPTKNFVVSFFWPSVTACRFLIPRPGMELMTPAMEAQSPTHQAASEAPTNFFSTHFRALKLQHLPKPTPLLRIKKMCNVKYIELQSKSLILKYNHQIYF